MPTVSKPTESGGLQNAAKSKKSFKCPLCDRTYTWKKSFERHVDSHKTRYECKACDQDFKRQFDLEVHERIHLGKKPYSCPNCDHSCSRKHALDVHYKSCIEKSIPIAHKRLFECDKCDKRYASKPGLYMHQTSHTDRFKCDACGVRMGSACQLRIHKNIHQKLHIGRVSVSDGNFSNSDVTEEDYMGDFVPSDYGGRIAGQ